MQRARRRTNHGCARPQQQKKESDVSDGPRSAPAWTGGRSPLVHWAEVLELLRDALRRGGECFARASDRVAVVRPSLRPLRSLREVRDSAGTLEFSRANCTPLRNEANGQLQNNRTVRYLTQRSQRAQRRTNHDCARPQQQKEESDVSDGPRSAPNKTGGRSPLVHWAEVLELLRDDPCRGGECFARASVRVAVVRPSLRPLRSLREVRDSAGTLEFSRANCAPLRNEAHGQLQNNGTVHYLTQRSQRARRRTNHGCARPQQQK